MHTHATAGNSFITEVTEHIAQCSLVALALNPSDESLQVSREKVNGHIYHMLKDGEIALPEPVGVTGCGCGVTHDTKWLGGIYCKQSWVRWGSPLVPLAECSYWGADPLHTFSPSGAIWHSPGLQRHSGQQWKGGRPRSLWG